MVSRHWKGIAKAGQDGAYIDHLVTDTFPKLARIEGFVRASILTRPREEGTEFQVVTVWESLGAIRAFAGDDSDVAVVPDAVRELMVSYDGRVHHYDIVRIFEAS